MFRFSYLVKLLVIVEYLFQTQLSIKVLLKDCSISLLHIQTCAMLLRVPISLMLQLPLTISLLKSILHYLLALLLNCHVNVLAGYRWGLSWFSIYSKVHCIFVFFDLILSHYTAKN